MTASMTTVRIGLVVLYTDRLEDTLEFYSTLGLAIVEEQHGSGPVHYAATLPGGVVVEVYPATGRRPASSVRFGFHVVGQEQCPPLSAGRHVVKDPDGRAVELYAV